MASKGYRIPAETRRTEITVVNSRFITTTGFAETAAAAKAFVAAVRAEMPDANHHVYAFRAGYGKSITEGMSDDGEPSGTSGPPVLAVLRGADIGDIVMVVTRYFGGTKLGTGGLVRAYTEAAQSGLDALVTRLKIERSMLGVETPYPYYQPIRQLAEAHEGELREETFGSEVTLLIVFPVEQVAPFTAAVIERTAGTVTPFVLEPTFE